MKGILLTYFCLFIAFTCTYSQNTSSKITHLFEAQTQESCGFDKIHQQLLLTPAYQKAMLANANNIRIYKNTGGNRNGVTTVPVVVHVMHHGDALGAGTNIPDAQIQSAIDNMNDAFAHTGAYNDGAHTAYTSNSNPRFMLAQTAPDGSATTGIVRVDVSGEAWQANYNVNGILLPGGASGVAEVSVKGLSIWPSIDYMNIWLVNRIDGGGTCFGVIGYAYFPGTSQDVDGMVVIAGGFGYDPTNALWPSTLCGGLNLNGTANHEGGHYFNLYHTFEGDANGTGCPGAPGDECADTPAHIRSSNCPADDPTGNGCTGGGPNTYIHNFMDYSSDACYHGFSEDQKTRIDASIATTGTRNGFCSAAGGSAPTGTYPTVVGCTPSNTSPGSNLGTESVNLNGTTWYSQGEFYDGSYLNRIASQVTVDLIAGQMYTVSATAATGNDEQSHIYIDYNNDGDFIDVNEDIGTTSTLNPSGTLSFTVPASGVTLGQRIRFRIITDFTGSASISGPCHNPQYGQVEDYAVKVMAPMPIELVEFELEIQNPTIHLQWQTQVEINNDYFIIEKSKDGIYFEAIKKIVGADDANTLNKYKYIDKTPFDGLNYYRLKQVDFNLSFTYSEVLSAEFSVNIMNINIYPNPTKSHIFIDYQGQEKINNIYVVNIKGEQVLKFLPEKEIFPLQGIVPGVYFVTIEFDNHKKVSKKIIVN